MSETESFLRQGTPEEQIGRLCLMDSIDVEITITNVKRSQKYHFGISPSRRKIMKKHNFKLIFLILGFVCFGAGIFVARAMEQVADRSVTVAQNQAVEDDLIVAGRK